MRKLLTKRIILAVLLIPSILINVSIAEQKDANLTAKIEPSDNFNNIISEDKSIESFSQLKLYYQSKNQAIRNPQTIYAPDDEIITSYVGSSLWFGMSDIKSDGNFIYGVMQYGLIILDISNPSSPSEIAWVDLPDGNAWDMEIDGGYAYIADGDNGLIIIDISDPYNPFKIRDFKTQDYALDVDIHENYAFIADGNGGLQIIDISDPYNPAFAGKWDSHGIAIKVAVFGQYAYLADNQHAIQILNIANPSETALVGAFGVDGYVMDIVIDDGLAYVASDRSGLLIYDVSDPRKPFILGNDVSSGANGIVIDGDFAYVTSGDANGLQIYNISNPRFPSLAGHQEIPGLILSIILENNFAYVAEWNSGLKTIDVSSLSNPILVGGYPTSGAIRDLEIKDGYAYTASSKRHAGNASLQISDLTISSHPEKVAEIELPGPEAVDIEISGNFAYLADLYYGMQIIDISNPMAPLARGSYPTPDHCLDIAISGNLAFTANDLGGIEIIDVANPEAPQLTGSYPTNGPVTSIAVNENLLFMCESGYGLKIIDISAPEFPIQIGQLNFSGVIRDIKIRDDYAYIANESTGLMVVNISNPELPVLSNTYAPPNNPVAIDLAGNYAYITDVFHGLRIYNIRDPQNIYHTGDFAGRGLAWDIKIEGEKAYIADYYGLTILNLLRPSISVLPMNMNFEAYQDGNNPELQSLQIENSGAGSLVWSASHLMQWLTIDAESGIAPSALTASVDITGLTEDTYFDTISISTNAEISPLKIPVKLTIHPPNHIPTLAAIEPQTVDENEDLNGNVTAEDLDGTIPILKATHTPDNFIFHNNGDGSGTYLFHPEFSQAGEYTILFTAEDQFDSLLIDSMELIITVNNINRAPYFVSNFIDTTIIENDNFRLILKSIDPDNDPISMDCYRKPTGTIFTDSTNGTGYLEFKPTYLDVDSQYVLGFAITDTLGDGSQDSLSISIVNRQLEIINVQIGPNPWNPGFNEVLIDSNIQIVFNEDLREESLASNIQLLSALGEDLQYQYDPERFSLFVSGSSPHLMPLDTITIILAGHILDKAGYELGTDHEWVVHTGVAVYPGDTNNDGVVDERDILPIGAFWDVNGIPRRNSPDCVWSMVPAHTWAPLGATFADADGSGLVDAEDICGIAQNWERNVNSGVREKYNISDIYSSLERLDQDVLQEMLTALDNCDESQGKSIITEILETMLVNQSSNLPESMELSQNYPNPFNPSTLIEFAISARSTVEISVFALDGRKVKTVINTINEPGRYSVIWDGTDDSGSPVASGVYFYRLKTNQTTISHKMLLLK